MAWIRWPVCQNILEFVNVLVSPDKPAVCHIINVHHKKHWSSYWILSILQNPGHFCRSLPFLLHPKSFDFFLLLTGWPITAKNKSKLHVEWHIFILSNPLPMVYLTLVPNGTKRCMFCNSIGLLWHISIGVMD